VTLFHLGARGVVLKDSGSTVLVRAIRTIMTGRSWLDRESVSDLVHAVSQLNGKRARPARDFGLTARELEIVAAVATASCNKEIAHRFSIAEKTVKHHLTNIFDKVGVSNRLELALFALNHGLHTVTSRD
jgi:DNA-binding NarL/FixJ family response regulator